MNEVLALPMSTVALRLLAAFVLGGIIGLERDRPAGLRTHIPEIPCWPLVQDDEIGEIATLKRE